MVRGVFFVPATNAVKLNATPNPKPYPSIIPTLLRYL